MRISRNRSDSPSWAEAFSALEQRVLLTGGDGGGTELIQWHGGQLEVMPHSWIVTFDSMLGADAAVAATNQIVSRLGVQASRVRSVARGWNGAFEVTAGSVTESRIAQVVAQTPGLVAIEPNAVRQVERIPNDPLFTGQWGSLNTGQPILGVMGVLGADTSATRAWDTTIGSENVIIADIDTGMDIHHPDLATNVWRNPGEIPNNGVDDDHNGVIDDWQGYDFGDGDPDVSDDLVGHGTWTSGVIGAVGNNGIGVAGVDWTASILPLKVADQFGRLSIEAVIQSHDYLTNLITTFHYNIVASNNSYGTFGPAITIFNAAEEAAIQRFTNTGATFVASAGNSANNNDAVFTTFPASYQNPEIIAVAATDNRDNMAGFSSYGLTTVDLGAPGVDVLSTAVGGGYDFVSGTSFSGPYTAGAVGLLKTHKPNASQEEIKRALLDGADRIPSLQGRVVSGGRLNIANSLRLIDIAGPRVVSVFPGPVASDVNVISIEFDRPINAAVLDATFITLRQANGDGVFDGNDVFIAITNLNLALSGDVLTIDLSGAFPGGFPVDDYRLILDANGFRDFNGNYLNGTTAPPSAANNFTYEFRVINSSGAFEPNDTISQATPVIFDSSGTAFFPEATVGDGVNSALDVDLYRFELSGPGLIVGTVTAQHLLIPSGLDSYVRLFNAAGAELAHNDNFDGLDSRLEFFVSTGGVYYIGVSGFGNAAYSALVPGTSAPQSNGDYSLTMSVDLAATDSNSYNSSNPPIPIPVIGTVSDTITITDSRVLVDVNVRLDITHTFDGNLQVRLISPAGTIIPLVLNRGGSGDNFVGTVFDDETARSIATGAAPFTGSFRPEVTLSTLDGQSAAGVWTLRITDTSPLDSGTLVAWGLDLVVSNDVFGPFELNDTIGIATASGINGTGSRTFNAAIGDGAFGLRDVDLYQFSAASGSTLTAAVNVTGGTLNSVLRLFDESGNELIIDNRSDTTSGSLSFNVEDGGTFYIGVSGGPNTSYSLLTGASGARTSGTGTYRLTITVTGGISTGAVVLDGNNLDLGINSDGSIGVTDSRRTGISLNGIDFLVPQAGTAPIESYYGATFSGFSFRNSGGTSDLPVALTNESDFNNRRVSIDGTFRGLSMRRSFSYGVNDQFVAVDVMLTNSTTTSTFTDVAWMEAFNPETGLNRRTTSNRTFNNVQNATGRLVTGAFFDNDFQGGLTVGLGAANPSLPGVTVRTAVQGPGTVRDPFQIINNLAPDPDPVGDTGVSANAALAIAFDLGVLAAGDSVAFRYFILTGTSVAAVNTLFATVNGGTGTGHLVQNPNDPAIPEDTLPYVEYYPEGYANSRASTFVPIVNPNDDAARVVVIAHYERTDTGPRDQLLSDSIVAGHTRSGLTLTTPGLYAANQQLVRRDEPYAIEIRSSRPVAANLSHFDFGVATGESFSTTTSTVWTFGEGFRVPLPADGSEPSVNDFVVFYNTSPQTINVTVTIYPEQGGGPVTLTRQIGGFRRGGFALAHELSIPNGPFGIKVEAEQPIVAALTHFDTNIGGGFGVLGTPNLGSLTGVTPEGQLGINATSEFVTILNANNLPANVGFTFFFANGSSYREQVSVPANHRGGFSVGSLPSFPVGQQSYSIAFDSDQPITVTLPSFSHGEATGSAFAERASSLWLFADGFRPLAGGQVVEYLRLYNPNPADVTVEITINFNDGGSETFRRVVNPRGSNEFNIHDFVTGSRAVNGTVPGVGSFYGLTVRSPTPVVAYMGHFDANFFGGFGTLGMPLGNTGAVL
jgi:subtilisin-like proprotein convertase family protein